mmetsp:Transcript_1402/g.3175  ORF Transcript_1402/g.3175 Transcript_1402/m.3175 type:complete len:222 (-) Transcript_1402:82-747(-)
MYMQAGGLQFWCGGVDTISSLLGGERREYTGRDEGRPIAAAEDISADTSSRVAAWADLTFSLDSTHRWDARRAAGGSWEGWDPRQFPPPVRRLTRRPAPLPPSGSTPSPGPGLGVAPAAAAAAAPDPPPDPPAAAADPPAPPATPALAVSGPPAPEGPGANGGTADRGALPDRSARGGLLVKASLAAEGTDPSLPIVAPPAPVNAVPEAGRARDAPCPPCL